MHRARTTMKIGLMGPFGYGNLGDASIQEAMIQNIRRYCPEAQIFGFSLDPEDTERRHGIPSFPISRMSRREATGHRPWHRLATRLRNNQRPLLNRLERWVLRLPIEGRLLVDAHRNLKDLDVLIISGGGQLDDYWGRGPFGYPYTLVKFSLLARIRGAKLMVVSVGAGPVNATLSRLFIRIALSLASYRSYRDEYSRNYIENIVGFRGDDPVFADLAHSLQVESVIAHRSESTRPVVGIGPVGYFRPGSWPEHDEAIYADYLFKMSTFVSWLIEIGYLIVFLSGEAHFDQFAISDLKERIKITHGAIVDERIIDAPMESLADLLRQLSTTDLIVASRFHNILLSQLVGTPAVALSYQMKIDALMADTGQADYCLPIATFDVEVLKQRFLKLAAKREQAQEEIALRTQIYRNRLQEQYECIFREI